MSTLIWDGDNLVQRVGENVEELGYVKLDESTNTVVLWLKDTRDVFNLNKGYVRGDSYSSMKDAKNSAAHSASTHLFHYMWMVGLRDIESKGSKEVIQSIEDISNGKPVTESTFKEKMAKSEKRQYWSIGISIISIFVAVVAVIF